MVSALERMVKQEKYIKEFSYLVLVKLVLKVDKYISNQFDLPDRRFFNLNFRSLYLFYREYRFTIRKQASIDEDDNSIVHRKNYFI